MIDQQAVGIALVFLEAIAITQVKKKYVVGLTLFAILTVTYFFIIGSIR